MARHMHFCGYPSMGKFIINLTCPVWQLNSVCLSAALLSRYTSGSENAPNLS